MRNYQAANELERIRQLSAFNVNGTIDRRKLNQHATIYSFKDGSRLLIRTTAGRADAWHPVWCGVPEDVHLGPVMGVPIRVNATGDLR